MKSLFDSWKRKKGLDLETELRAARPQAPERLVRSIAASINPRPVRARNRRSLGFVGALGVATLAMLGATGGFSYAAGGVANAVHAAAKVVNVSPPPRPPSHAPVPSKPNSGSSSSCAQYGHTATVTSVSPSFGVAGSKATIVIHGTNLQGATSATLAGQDVTILGSTATTVRVSLQSLSSLTSGSTGPAVVTTCVGDATGGTFTIIAKPSVSDFNNSGGNKDLQTGQTVTISGSGFTGVAANGVKFDKKIASDATVQDDGTITVTVPVGLPATGHVSVTNKAGTATSTASFTYSALSPVIKKVSVKSGVAAGQHNDATHVVITGSNFDAGDTVWFGSVEGNVIDSSTPGQLTVTAPSNGGAGPVKITVKNSLGGASTSSTTFQAYYNPNPTGGAPLIDTTGDGVFGAKAGGTITITGTHLTGTSSVQFAGAAKSSKPTKVTDGSITVAVPKDAHSGDITVTNPANSTTLGGLFQLLIQAPAGLSGPTSAHKGDTITLSSTFPGSFWAATVKVGSVSATVNSISANGQSMSITIPNSSKLKLGTQKITITNPVKSATISITLN